MGFINIFCHNQPLGDVHDLDMTQNENEFDILVWCDTFKVIQAELQHNGLANRMF